MLEEDFGKMAEEKVETGDDMGNLFDIVERIRELLTQFNDTIKGKCAICLNLFKKLQDPE